MKKEDKIKEIRSKRQGFLGAMQEGRKQKKVILIS